MKTKQMRISIQSPDAALNFRVNAIVAKALRVAGVRDMALMYDPSPAVHDDVIPSQEKAILSLNDDFHVEMNPVTTADSEDESFMVTSPLANAAIKPILALNSSLGQVFGYEKFPPITSADNNDNRIRKFWDKGNVVPDTVRAAAKEKDLDISYGNEMLTVSDPVRDSAVIVIHIKSAWLYKGWEKNLWPQVLNSILDYEPPKKKERLVLSEDTVRAIRDRIATDFGAVWLPAGAVYKKAAARPEALFLEDTNFIFNNSYSVENINFTVDVFKNEPVVNVALWGRMSTIGLHHLIKLDTISFYIPPLYVSNLMKKGSAIPGADLLGLAKLPLTVRNVNHDFDGDEVGQSLPT